MQSIDSTSGNGKTFWKKNSKSVPGRGSPRKESFINRRNESSLDSFQDYQASVNDAWECGDDEFSVISDVKISNRVAQTTALNVIHTHRLHQTTSPKSSMENVENTVRGRSSPLELDPNLATNTSGAPPSSSSSGKPSGYDSRKGSLSNNSSSNYQGNLGDHRDTNREDRFIELIKASTTDLSELRNLVMVRCSPRGYLPANAERREETLKRKREEYWSFVRQYFNTRIDDQHHDTYRQIHIDIPRMSPLVPLFQQSIVQEMFERVLYIWAIRHPASGYVQGINDLVTPFFIVFIYGFVPLGQDLDTYDIGLINEEDRAIVEADSFWCMNRLLDGIQDNYTFAQPGIQHKVCQLRELIHRIDANLHRHLEKHEIDYLQFSFRWFNNLLMREIPLRCTIRLWDTLHAEPDGFSHFVLYVCAAFLTHFSTQLMQQRDFQSLMLLLQSLPTRSWGDNEVSVIVAEAFRLKYVFADAPNHLPGSKGGGGVGGTITKK
ncbi:TBC1 domain family member 22B [Armadillidium vulgare]|nr:TBC1 domain family member 22B [Armadillidium vulgare]